MNVLLAAAFVILVFYARVFSLTVQDRVIRLEMRLRLERAVVCRTCAREFRNSRFRSWFRCASRPIKNCRCWRGKCWMKS